MRGIRFSMLLATPLIIGALYTGFNLFYLEKDFYLFWLIGFLAVLIAIYVGKGEIDYWYDKKYPPKLDPPVISWLTRFFPFYNSLEGEDRSLFENRLAVYLDARDFSLMLKEKDKIPDDFKAIIAAHGVRMTMGMKDNLIGDYDRIVCYNHPFPTPYNKFLHTVETHADDGVILLSIEQLMMGVGKPDKYYNLAYHAYAEALVNLNPGLSLNENEMKWEDIEKLLGYEKKSILNLTGYEDLDLNVVSLAAFFIKQSKFEEKHPEISAKYKEILNYVY